MRFQKRRLITWTGRADKWCSGPSTTGILAGFQHPLEFAGGHQTVLVNYGYGDVINGSGDGAITTIGTPVSTVSATAGDVNVAGRGITSRKNSQALNVGLTNAQEYQDADVGLLYAAFWQLRAPKDMKSGNALTASIRPMKYLTSHLHLGVELDGAKYFQKVEAGDVTYRRFRQ